MDIQTLADDAFKTELTGLIPQMRAFARSLCRDAVAADDLAQDALLKAWNNRSSYQAGTNMKAWTFTIMRNNFLNDLRKSRRQTELDPEVAEKTLVAHPEQEGIVHMSDLQRALDQLPAERREALLLVGAGGFAYEEAAQVCGVPVGTMKSRVARGRAQLQELMEPAAMDPSRAG